MKSKKVLIIGAGLAGSDAAYFLAEKGIQVHLVDSKPVKLNPAQKMKGFAELVCTNSLKSTEIQSAHGVLKYEMEKMGSLIIKSARETSVPAGKALAVDREKFSELVTKVLKEHPQVEFSSAVVGDPIQYAKDHNCDYIIVATGPLTDSSLESWIKSHISDNDLYFYDAIAPVVDGESLNYDKLFFKDRNQVKEEGIIPDYLNAPMNEDEYFRFVDAMREAEKVQPKDFEEYKFFEGCLPIDLMAERGRETPRFSCMRPIGLETEEHGKPYAIVQLRRENLLGSAYNIVGMQTRLTFGEQKRIFRMIPGLEEADFIHMGQVHRNTFLNSRKVLNKDNSSKEFSHLYFAGQITGVEGYTESAASGLYVAYQLLRRIKEEEEVRIFPVETAIGALVHYCHTAQTPAPSNIHFGLMPPVEIGKVPRMKRALKKRMKREKMGLRAKESFDQFYGEGL
jgi:methylenetetrahydrofolate--tRNA-(uracil-5-)-methyltransferase